MIYRIPLIAALLLAGSPLLGHAQTLKPLPNPDLSRLEAAENGRLREQRSQFEKDKASLKGVALAEAYADLGAAYARMRLNDAALVAFDNAAAIVPEDDRWPYLQGVIARSQGRHRDARQHFQRAFDLNALYLPTRLALAGEMMRAGELEPAKKLLTAQLVSQRNEPALQAVLGDIELQQKHYAEATSYLREAIRLDPLATSLYYPLAQARAGAGDSKGAAEATAKVGDVPPRLSDPLLQRVLPLIPGTDESRGSSAGTAAPPSDPKERITAEVTFYISARDFVEARRRLDAGLKQFPNDALLLTAYARVEAAAGKLDAAKTRARAAVAAGPKLVPAWMVQGLVLEMANDDAGARDAYRRALALDAKLPRAQLALGNIAMRGGRPAEAVQAYRAVSDLVPEDGNSRGHLLAAQFAAGQCAQGMKDADSAAKATPKDPLLAELSIRATSTCAAATAAQKRAALSMAASLYQQTDADNLARVGEAYALALAANGKWEEATQTQGASVFEAVRAVDEDALAQYRDFYARFNAKQLPQRPWAADHPLFKPVRPQPLPPLPAAAAKPAAKP